MTLQIHTIDEAKIYVLAIPPSDPDELKEHDADLCALIEATTNLGLLESAFYGSISSNVLSAIAANRLCPEELVRRLYGRAQGSIVKQRDLLLLANIADSQATPIDILFTLTRDQNAVVRLVARHNLAKRPMH